MSFLLRDSYAGSLDAGDSFGSTRWRYQTFTTGSAYSISMIKLKLYKSVTASPRTVTASIRATDGDGKPTGNDLCSYTFDGNTLTGTVFATSTWEELIFNSPADLTANTKYAIVMRVPDGVDTVVMWVAGDFTSPSYTDGNNGYSTNSGSSWTAQTFDWVFYTYTTSGGDVFVEKKYSKKLVAIGNSEIWYESSAGTMAELTAANNAINTNNSLTATEALQKVFIANQTNLKIADFANTKISTTDLNTHAPDKGNTLTGGTSGAKMIVDYITSVVADAACTIYGFRTTTATFASGETVTGTDDDGNAITFVLSAAETAPPHWYNWTSYGNDTTNFGTMPSQANLVCLYRGRLVLAGDRYYPHQWYMSRVINPWDWKYVVNDPLSPIRGGNADAGEIGDIIKALIPLRDDYLIIGCANSIWLMRGDPTAGGSIDPITDKTGMYGPRAWCFDDTNTLYFFGKNGLYSLTAGATQPPENISQAALPNWISGWDLDESSHRIVLSFDPIRRGISISKTALTDGTNSNYYYDLKIGGFYPESYPTACGIFSAHYYDSTDNTYKRHLFGTNDGYIRYFLDSAKDDDAGASDTAISSYLVYPIIQMSEEDDKEGKLISLTFEVAGGASGGAFGDSDGFSYDIHVANDGETALEHVKDNATPFTTGSFSTTGRQNRIRTRVRGRWLALKIYNSTASETFAINTITGNIVPAGKIK